MEEVFRMQLRLRENWIGIKEGTKIQPRHRNLCQHVTTRIQWSLPRSTWIHHLTKKPNLFSITGTPKPTKAGERLGSACFNPSLSAPSHDTRPVPAVAESHVNSTQSLG